MEITEQGTWTDSYRPLKIRVSATHNLGGTWSLTLRDTSNNTIASLEVPNGGSDTANIDWSNNLDIDDIVDNDAPTGQITNIEFFEVS
jgi:U3 small nucleolar RNA-associated protein 14